MILLPGLRAHFVYPILLIIRRCIEKDPINGAPRRIIM